MVYIGDTIHLYLGWPEGEEDVNMVDESKDPNLRKLVEVDL